jgi:hypothetical protein
MGSPPINYSVIPNYSVLPNGDTCIYLGGHMLDIPLSTAEVLAVKMTSLSNDPWFRKKKKQRTKVKYV